jgi:hypothetical protein
VTDQLKVGDRVMYNGKEMTLTRISKDGRFQNGIEMKFVNEGDSTQTGGKTLLGNMMYAKPVKEKGPATVANKLEGGEKEGEKSGAKDKGNLPSDAKKVMNALAGVNSKYKDPNLVQVEATPKGNWAVYYDGKYTGTTINGAILSDATVEKLGWEYHDVD